MQRHPVKEASKKDCKHCKYHSDNQNLGGTFCNYINLTGHIRSITKDGCFEFERGKKLVDNGKSFYDI